MIVQPNKIEIPLRNQIKREIKLTFPKTLYPQTMKNSLEIISVVFLKRKHDKGRKFYFPVFKFCHTFKMDDLSVS